MVGVGAGTRALSLLVALRGQTVTVLNSHSQEGFQRFPTFAESLNMVF